MSVEPHYYRTNLKWDGIVSKSTFFESTSRTTLTENHGELSKFIVLYRKQVVMHAFLKRLMSVLTIDALALIVLCISQKYEL